MWNKPQSSPDHFKLLTSHLLLAKGRSAHKALLTQGRLAVGEGLPGWAAVWPRGRRASPSFQLLDRRPELMLSCVPLSIVSLSGRETAFGVSHFSALNRSCKWFRIPSCLSPWEGVGQCWGGGWEAGPSVHCPLCARGPEHSACPVQSLRWPVALSASRSGQMAQVAGWLLGA